MKNTLAEGAEATPEVSVRCTISSVLEDCEAHTQQHFQKEISRHLYLNIPQKNLITISKEQI